MTTRLRLLKTKPLEKSLVWAHMRRTLPTPCRAGFFFWIRARRVASKRRLSALRHGSGKLPGQGLWAARVGLGEGLLHQTGAGAGRNGQMADFLVRSVAGLSGGATSRAAGEKDRLTKASRREQCLKQSTRPLKSARSSSG